MAMSWLKRLFKQLHSATSGRNAKRLPRRSTRLTLEALESRTVPTVFNVTTTADILGGANLSLRQAILDSNQTAGPNTINLTVPGTYQLTRFGNAHNGSNGALQITNQNLTINGQGATTTAIDGGGVDRVFDIEGALSVAFTGVTIQHGLASSNGNKGIDVAGNAADGGGIYSPLANLTLTNTVIANNLADDAGGGIWTDTGNVTINGGSVSNNLADDPGGALYTNSGTISVTNATFANNVADSDGGAIVIDATTAGNLTIVGSTFTGNSADGDGGAIADFSTVNHVSITGSTITDNTADDEGGGLFVEAATLTIDRSTISNNTADSSGGGIEDDSNSHQVLSITNSSVDGNTAEGDGGGLESNAATATFTADSFSNNVSDDSGSIDFFGPQLTIANSHFDGNRTEGSEAGIEMFSQMNGSSCTISNSTFDNNHAASEEAGGFIECTTLMISQSSINNNRSGSSIGGLEIEVTSATFTNVNAIGNFAGSSEGGLEIEDTTLTMTGCIINNNQSGSSVGGLFAEGTATLSNTTISGNRAGSSEGGLEFEGTQLNLQSDTITNNFAGNSDGGVFDESSNGGTISNTTVSGNWAASEAGGLETDILGGTLTITGSNISKNHAGTDGGGLLDDGTGTVTLSNDTLFGNTAAINGGGIAHEFGTGTLNLSNVTIDGNAAANGGGVFSNRATVNVHNSILAGNSANTTKGPDVDGTFASQGFNLIGVADAASTSFTNGMKNDQVGSVTTPKDSRLGTLQNNGGLTFTQALLPGSPAIGQGDHTGAPLNDQRGFSRPAMPSIGAYEPQSASNASANQVFVENLYEVLLNRTADPGAAFWVNQLNAGTSPTSVVQAIENSGEYRTSQVQALYQHYLRRDGDAGGLQFFVNLLNNGGTLEQVAAMMLGSPEYFAMHGGSNDAFLFAAYQDALGRQPDSGGLVFFTQALAGGVSRNQIASMILSSTEYQTELVQADFRSMLGRQPDSAGLAFFVNELQHGSSDQVVLAQILGSGESFAKRS